MTEQRRTALKELQKLDIRIQKARQRIRDFDPMFEEVEEPALILESELSTSRNRLKEMKLESRRLELGTEEKRERQKRLDERLGSVRNLREEAAVSAELEMVKRALQSDEQEGYTLLDQIRKVEERVAEVEAAFAEATELVEPKREELLRQREEAKSELGALEKERERFTGEMPADELRTYDAIRSGGRRVAVAELTHDGACGNCYGVVPLQVKNEILHGDVLIRCEGCGVILAAPEPEPEGGRVPEAPPSESVAADAENGPDQEDGETATAAAGVDGEGEGDSADE